MKRGSTIAQALEPKATWSAVECVCGHSVRVPSALGGREGTCPACFRSFQTRGEPSECPRAGGVFISNHPDRESKRLGQEPNFANPESGFVAAQRQATIPGVVYLIATLLVAQALIAHSSAADAALGMNGAPRWLLPAWLLSAWLVAASCTATAAIVFHYVAGKSYSLEMVAFAAAGGYDIARWMPLLGYILLYAICVNTLVPAQVDPLAFVRNPWFILFLGAVIGHVATWLVAWRVFASRFKPSL
jgi:hypothetical protein